MNLKTSFYSLDPNVICACAEKHGYRPTGEILQLNSIENRVFDIKLEIDFLNDASQVNARGLLDHSLVTPGSPKSIIAKFYRPGRWSLDTIRDEHNFEIELKNEGLEVAAPLFLKNGSTADTVDEIHFAFFEKVRGRLIQEYLPHHFKKMGRWLAQLHNIGEARVAQNRFEFGPTSERKWDQLYDLERVIAPEVKSNFMNLSETIFSELDEQLADMDYLRIHGDLHRGNILEADDRLVVVDFDDFLNGPVVQDVWMLFPEEEFQDSEEFENFVTGYEDLRIFPYEQLQIVPLLRAYRMISYSAWIQRRWDDPSFKRLFPQFETFNYWAEQEESVRRLLKLT